MKLFSRHNQVRLVGNTVRKHFDSPEDWEFESRLLRELEGKLPVPKVLQSVPGTLLMERLPGETLLDELERQERDGFYAAPWQSLCDWLRKMHSLTGLVPGDGNLRNFLWHTHVSGVDFEHYRPGTLKDAGSRIAAFSLEYSPANTSVKQQAAGILARNLEFTEDELLQSRTELLARRAKKKQENSCELSFILLAGGHSRRMGSDKAALPLLGISFLEHQIEKARILGANDILLSGVKTSFEGTRSIADVYPDRGPLGGIYSCLMQAKHPRCFVLGIDTPLIPASELRKMPQQHLQSDTPLTVAVHGDRMEPLIGIYDASLAQIIEPMLPAGGPPVRALLQEVAWHSYLSHLPEAYWMNCNTPEAYQSLTSSET